MRKVTFLAVITGLLFASVVSADNLYRWVDKDGNVTYSSKKQHKGSSQIISIQETPEFLENQSEKKNQGDEVVPKAASAGKKKKQETQYQSLVIVSPEPNQAIRENSGQVRINLAMEPNLDQSASHQIVFSLDGVEQRSSSTLALFSNVSRGLHTVSAHVENSDGKVLIRSPSVTFQLHRFSKKF